MVYYFDFTEDWRNLIETRDYCTLQQLSDGILVWKFLRKNRAFKFCAFPEDNANYNSNNNYINITTNNNINNNNNSNSNVHVVQVQAFANPFLAPMVVRTIHTESVVGILILVLFSIFLNYFFS